MLIQNLLWLPTFPTLTVVPGIKRVQAGRVSRFPPSGKPPFIGQEIWAPPTETLTRYDLDELTEELRFLIHQAVDRWMIGVPFAVSMSGGIDSSTVWWAVSQRLSAGDSQAALGAPYSFIRPNHPFDEAHS